MSKMLVTGSNRRGFGVDAHLGMVITGVSADGRQLVNRAREEAKSYQDLYGHKIVPSVLANRLGLYMHYFTLYGALRPFGSTALIAAYDEDLKAPELYMVEPSGVAFRYFGCAAGNIYDVIRIVPILLYPLKGKGANAAKTELEKLISRSGQDGISSSEAVKELAKMYHPSFSLNCMTRCLDSTPSAT